MTPDFGPIVRAFEAGECFDAHRYFGVRIDTNGARSQTTFTVYAPNAARVHVRFDEGKRTAMRRVHDAGVFSCSFPADLSGVKYHYEITIPTQETLIKSDPFGFRSAVRPDTFSIAGHPPMHRWTDRAHMDTRRETAGEARPIVIYEMHLGSWMRKPDGTFNDYDMIAERLVPYVLKHHFTHVEFLPLVEHPLDESWGYQGTGYFSATSRFGSPEQCMRLIDALHANGIGVILDWVPGHIGKDAHGLHFFDGTPLYEIKEKTFRENPVWGTSNLDLASGPARSYLISNALFWANVFHIDGFRIDAVANIIHPLGDPANGVNEHALDFLRTLTHTVRQKNPGILFFAEDSTSFPGVTHEPKDGGLGFDYKWNLGWMHDTLAYFEQTPQMRTPHRHNLTFSIHYAYGERYVLPFSHDEVVHGKRSLWLKMPGTDDQKFANLKLLLGYQATHPGKKLLFMGQEFAQPEEWKDYSEIDWKRLSVDAHHGVQAFVAAMNKLVVEHGALHRADDEPGGFTWLAQGDDNVVAYMRTDIDSGQRLIVVFNMSDTVKSAYRLGIEDDGEYDVIIHSHHVDFNGNVTSLNTYRGIDAPAGGFSQHLTMTLAPLSMMVLSRRD